MFRIKLFTAGRLAALALFVSIAAALVIYLKVRDTNSEPVQRPPKLQGRVVAVFNNTRYAHEVEGRVRFELTAGVDRTYEDGTHELEQVRLESRGSDESSRDVVTADRAKVSDPADLNKLDAEFISNVVVETANGLIVKTNYLHYDQAKNIVETQELVEFEGRTFAGRSTGLLIEVEDERAHLFKDVDLTIKSPSAAGGEKRVAGDNSGKAQKKQKRTPEEKAARKAQKRARRLAQNSGKPAQSKTSGGQIEAKFPTRIRSHSALLEKKASRVSFNGAVSVVHGEDEIRSGRMVGYLDGENRIERIEARANSHLKQGDRAEIKSADMDFFFGEGSQLVRAVAAGGAYARSLGPEPLREARAKTIEAIFTEGPQGNVVETLKGEGEASLFIHAPAPANDRDNPANRQLSANAIYMKFFPDGRNMQSAEAGDNAVMTVTPVRAATGADKKTIRAARMTGAFYEEGNRLKSFNATGGVRVEIEPTVADSRPPRVTTSRELRAEFDAESQDLNVITQEGDFKYKEGDRNATAQLATYDGRNEFLKLRGKRPMAWDAKARVQADEIDYNQKMDETHGRGDVRTTYYSRETTGESTPFNNTRSPVFVTAERADVRNADGVAVYTINARAWQDDNFVKADRLELYQKDNRMVAIGNVESALYNAKTETASGQSEVTPGFASADRMTYSDADRLIHYEGGVKVRHGTDRIEAAAIDAYLHEETNRINRLLAEGNVVMIQPGRRGVGDKLTYNAEDGQAVLTGRNARVDSTEHGTVMGAQLTFNSLDDKISADNQQSAGRVRSTHRLTKNRRE